MPDNLAESRFAQYFLSLGLVCFLISTGPARGAVRFTRSYNWMCNKAKYRAADDAVDALAYCQCEVYSDNQRRSGFTPRRERGYANLAGDGLRQIPSPPASSPKHVHVYPIVQT